TLMDIHALEFLLQLDDPCYSSFTFSIKLSNSLKIDKYKTGLSISFSFLLIASFSDLAFLINCSMNSPPYNKLFNSLKIVKITNTAVITTIIQLTYEKKSFSFIVMLLNSIFSIFLVFNNP